MPRRSNQVVCVLREAEAFSLEQSGRVADCRNHRHWGINRALKEMAAGNIREVKANLGGLRQAVVLIPTPDACAGGEWIPTLSADGQRLKTMQFHHAQK